MTYSIIVDQSAVRRDADGAIIPADPQNRDWQEYQSWLAAGHAPTPLPTPTLAEAKAARLAALADRRWRAETAGVVVNGARLPTDLATQGKLTAAVVASVLDNSYSVRWKLADGSFTLFDHATLVAAAQGVRAHVQACFDREAQLVALIDAAKDEAALAAIDIESGWPE
jgi:hypothetical protein